MNRNDGARGDARKRGEALHSAEKDAAHSGLRHEIARALGRALILAEDADGYTDWSEWHPCCDHPNCSTVLGTSPCPCSGIAFANSALVDAVMSVLPPGEQR